MDELFRYDPLTAGTKGLVFVGDKIIVYRRDNKTDKYPLHLDVPGGGPEANETPFETFQREVNEEFKLYITSKDIVYGRRYPSNLEKGKFGYYVVAKLPKEMAAEIEFGDEGIEYLLMSLEEYLARDDAWPIFQERAADYAKSLGK
jgi:8-oxo-dGTP diphosphatase